MEMINITTDSKFFYKLNSEDAYKIILESNPNKKDLFLDIINLLDDYSKSISKIVIHKSRDDYIESQIQIIVSKSESEPITKKIKDLNYKDLSEVN